MIVSASMVSVVSDEALQWIRVSSRSNTIVLWSSDLSITFKKITFMFLRFREVHHHHLHHPIARILKPATEFQVLHRLDKMLGKYITKIVVGSKQAVLLQL